MDGEPSNRAETEGAISNANRKRKREPNAVNKELLEMFHIYQIDTDGERKTKAKCLIENCKKTFLGQNVYNQNLYRHIREDHVDVHNAAKK